LVNTANDLDINPLKAKSITLVWEMMFTRSMYQTKDMAQQGQLLNKVSKLVDSDKIKAMVTQSLSPINVENITKAHTLIEQGNMIGKLVLTN
jgi:NADPH:quinone reductase-like Zn-dependent oxidoreductase